MAEEKPRAVSGEIMTDPVQGEAGASARSGDVIDADYISLPSEPSSAGARASDGSASPRSRETVGSIGSVAPPPGGMDILRRADPQDGPAKPARGGPLFWTVGICLVLAAFWISGGHALLRDIPFLGADSVRSALRISGVTSRVDSSGLRAILLVDGEAVNDGDAVQHLPPLEIAVTGNDGRVTRYRLGTSGRPLSSGETFAFSSRLDVPKNGVKTVSVTFAE